MASFLTTQTVIGEPLNEESFTFSIRYQLGSNETFKNCYIVDKNDLTWPRGLNHSVNSNSFNINGKIEDVNLYHPTVKDYLSSQMVLGGDEFADTTFTRKATLDDLCNVEIHYTGRNYGKQGIAGWYFDGNELLFTFELKLEFNVTSSSRYSGSYGLNFITKNFTIKVKPNYKPIYFRDTYLKLYPDL